MILNIKPDLVNKIESRYEKWLSCCPQKKKEIEKWIASADSDEAICIKYLYAYMHPSDIISYGVETIASYVRATLEMYANIPYAKTVPMELFFTYVLCVRINNEDLDASRSWIYEQLAERVKNKKSMAEAALEVNYWCFEKATYIPSDDRTLAPIGLCKSSLGRCGEESVLAVCAMRSVGIPARQCYVPRWAHCDDNHAWVEVWVDGNWHYLGACEPEAVLDKGWFTAAASKSMLVRAKACSDLDESVESAYKTPLYTLMNVTDRYADVETLTVTVMDGNEPVKGAEVTFGLSNYSEIYPLHKEKSKDDGRVSFVTGKGDLYVSASYDGKYVGSKVDLRKTQTLVLDMRDAIIPGKISGVHAEAFELNPPLEKIPKAPAENVRKGHEERLNHCEEIRRAYEAGFVKIENGKEQDIEAQENDLAPSKELADTSSKNYDNNLPREEEECLWNAYYAKARGNYEEIRRFRETADFADSDKRMLLDTLRDKDFIDTSAEVLLSYLQAAYSYKDKYPVYVYQNYLLAPRVINEKIVDNRRHIVENLKEKSMLVGINVTAADVWKYVTQELKVVPGYGMANLAADAAGCIRYGIITQESIRVVFVEICRALGIPARINPVTRKAEEVTVSSEGIKFFEIENCKEINGEDKVKLSIINKKGSLLKYWLNFTIGVYENGEYHTLGYGPLSVDDRQELSLSKGSYRIITTRRQIDGGVSCLLESFDVDRDMTIELCRGKSKISQKIMHVQLPDTTVDVIDASGSVKYSHVSMKSLYEGNKAILIFADPGKEPTEHLLQEILECREAYMQEKYSVIIALKNITCIKNETLQKVLATNIQLRTVVSTDNEYFYELHEILKVGDERLPFAIAINQSGEGLFAFANYNIRTAWTLMDILNV